MIIASVDAEKVMRLREETGAPLLACKKALYCKDGDYEEARAYLQTGAWRRSMLVTYNWRKS